MTIQAIQAREILDSRGLPTVEVSLWVENGYEVRTSVPAGTSIGKHEAVELRDKDQTRMQGMGVQQAVQAVNQIIAPQLIGMDVTQQTLCDQRLVDLDGTPNKSKLGANAILAVSQAILKAGAYSVNMPLFWYIKEKYQLTSQLQIPLPMFTMVSGGKHGTGNLDIQEFQVIPASNFTYEQSLNIGVTLYQEFGKVLKSKGAIHSVGIGGGYAPNLFHNIDVFELLIETIHFTPFVFARDVFFGVDVGADELLQGTKYIIKDKSQPFSSAELLEYYQMINKTYHVISIEDGYSQDNWKEWQILTKDLGDRVLIVGDNLITTNKERTEKAIQERACNAVLVKPNQIGTISETVEVIKISRDAGMRIIISHRSGETNDDFIADFAIGLGADYVKFGAPARGERVSKYNRMLEIDQMLRSWQASNTQ